MFEVRKGADVTEYGISYRRGLRRKVGFTEGALQKRSRRDDFAPGALCEVDANAEDKTQGDAVHSVPFLTRFSSPREALWKRAWLNLE